MALPTLPRKAGQRPPARQQVTFRLAEGGVVEAMPADDDIAAYERQRARVARQPADIQSMTHAADRPQRPVQIEGGLIGRRTLGSADYDRAGALSALLQAGYDAKTLPLYFTPAAPVAAAADFTEGFASGDPLQAGLGALGTPGRAAKAVGMAAAASMPSDAEATFLNRRAVLPHMRGALERAEQLLGGGRTLPPAELQALRRGTWGQEGFFKDPTTGDMVWELSDRNMVVRPRTPGLGPKYLPDQVEHPELYAAVPELKDVRLRYEDLGDGVGGYYTKGSNPEIVISDRIDRAERPGVVAHEIGHAASGILGMPPGGTPTAIMYDTLRPRIERGMELMTRRDAGGIGGGLSRDEARELAQIKADIAAAQSDRNVFYDLSHGEARSRLSQSDVTLSDQQRRARIPFENYRAARRPHPLMREQDLIVHADPEEMALHTERLKDYAYKLGYDRGSP